MVVSLRGVICVIVFCCKMRENLLVIILVIYCIYWLFIFYFCLWNSDYELIFVLVCFFYVNDYKWEMSVLLYFFGKIWFKVE